MPRWRMPVVGEAVHELQQLHGELDVADAAGAELELVRRRPGGDVLGDALPHALHAVDEVLARGAGPDLRLHGARRRRRRARRRRRSGAPSAGPGTPSSSPSGRSTPGASRACARARPACPPVAGSRRPPTAPGSISAPEMPRIVCTASRVAMSIDPALADGVCHVGTRTADEDDVDVADVVELAGAGLAHADDRELRRRDLLAREEPGSGRARRRCGCGRRPGMPRAPRPRHPPAVPRPRARPRRDRRSARS